MTKQEFQILTRKSAAQVRKLCDKGEFSVDGFGTFRAVKKGRGKTCPIDIRKISDDCPDQETQSSGAVENGAMQKLKQARMAVDIQLRQQQLAARQQEMESRILNDLVNAMVAALEPLKEAFRKCKLSTEQADLVNLALNESLKRVENLLNESGR